MISLYFLRHGKSEANRLNLVNGKTNDPLTLQGKKQALEAGKLIVASGIQFDLCFVSNWRRAQETAELALPGEEFTVDPRIGETDPGDIAELTFTELPELYPEFKLPFDPLRPYPGGESHQQLYDRSVAWFQEKICTLPEKTNVLTVSHGGPICSIIQHICKVDMRDFPMFVPTNASFSKITKNVTGQWTLRYFSLPGVQHLKSL